MYGVALQAAQKLFLQGEVAQAATVVLYHKLSDALSLFILASAARLRESEKLAYYVVYSLVYQEVYDSHVQILCYIAKFCSAAQHMYDVLTRNSISVLYVVARAFCGLELEQRQRDVLTAYHSRDFTNLRKYLSVTQLRRIAAASQFSYLYSKRSRAEFEAFSNKILEKYACAPQCISDAVLASAVCAGHAVRIEGNKFVIRPWGALMIESQQLRFQEIREVTEIIKNWDNLHYKTQLTAMQRLLLARALQLSGKYHNIRDSKLLEEFEDIGARFVTLYNSDGNNAPQARKML